MTNGEARAEARLLLEAEKEAIAREARRAGLVLRPEDIVEEVVHRDLKPRKIRKQPKAPFRKVLRVAIQKTGRKCIRVAVLECGHSRRIIAGAGKGRLRCSQCPEE